MYLLHLEQNKQQKSEPLFIEEQKDFIKAMNADKSTVIH